MQALRLTLEPASDAPPLTNDVFKGTPGPAFSTTELSKNKLRESSLPPSGKDEPAGSGSKSCDCA